MLLARLLGRRPGGRPVAAAAAVWVCAAAVVLAGCGANWEQIGPPQGWPSVLNAITCASALTCYLAGSGGSVARITNGTVVTPQPSPAHSDLYGIGCADPATCYAVGDDGTILALG